MPVTRLLLALLLAVPAVAAAGPRDDLLRVVPDDFAFCAVVQNLRGQGEGKSPFLEGMAASPLFQQLQQSPEAQKVRQVIDTILKELEVTPAQVVNDVLGEALVFAYRKGPPGQPEKEDGMILLHAPDEKLLARLVDRVNELQTKAGEIKGVEPVNGKQGRYFRRVKAVEGQTADFYALRGHRLVFSGSEALLNTTLAGLAAEGAGEPPLAKRMKALGVNDAPLVLLVNPRSFDADVGESAKAGKPAERAFLAEFARYWKAVDGLAVSVKFAPAIEVGLSLNVRKADLPAAAARFVAEAGKRSPLWDRVPDDALFAAVGRIHPESLASMLGAFLAEPDRKKVLDTITDATRPFLETDDFAPLARGIGPDVGFWVTAPAAADKTWVPEAVLAVKLADGPEGKQAEEAALKGLDFLARLAALSHKGLRVHSEAQGPVAVKYLTHPTAFPDGFRPAFASKGGYLVAASSPKAIGKFEPPTTQPRDADEVPIVRISVSAWRAYLRAHRGPVTDFLARTKGIEPEAMGRQLDGFLPILDGLERVELLQRSGPDRATLVVRLTEARKKP